MILWKEPVDVRAYTMNRGKAPTARGGRGRMQVSLVPVEGSLCSYNHRVCMQNKLEGQEYCLKHVLEDKNGSFKQCSYVSTRNTKRCHNAALKLERKESFCLDHMRKNSAQWTRSAQKRRPIESAESLLEEVTAVYSGKQSGTDGSKHSKSSSDSLASKVIDYASSSDSDIEPLLVDQAWRGDCDSDAESIDSEQEDPLKHAGTYTSEEVAMILRDKLIRLQSLYIDQFKRLQHVLKEKRRRYLQTYKQEREALGPIRDYKEIPDQRDKYDKLKALKRYHKKYGKEALLLRQSKQRRLAASEGQHCRLPRPVLCSLCNEPALPLTDFCINHILEDRHQVLFHPCSFGGNLCRRPVSNCGQQAFLCPPHEQLPPQKFQPEPTCTVTSKEVEMSCSTVAPAPDSIFDLDLCGEGKTAEMTQTDEMVDVSGELSVGGYEGYSDGGTQTTLFLNGKKQDLHDEDHMDTAR